MYVCMYVCMYSVGSTLTRCWNWLSDVAIILILLHTQRTKLSDTRYTIMICGVIHTVQAIRYSSRYRIAVGIELCSSFIYELISLVFSLGRRSDRLGGSMMLCMYMYKHKGSAGKKRPSYPNNNKDV